MWAGTVLGASATCTLLALSPLQDLGAGPLTLLFLPPPPNEKKKKRQDRGSVGAHPELPATSCRTAACRQEIRDRTWVLFTKEEEEVEEEK